MLFTWSSKVLRAKREKTCGTTHGSFYQKFRVMLSNLVGQFEQNRFFLMRSWLQGWLSPPRAQSSDNTKRRRLNAKQSNSLRQMEFDDNQVRFAEGDVEEIEAIKRRDPAPKTEEERRLEREIEAKYSFFKFDGNASEKQEANKKRTYDEPYSFKESNQTPRYDLMNPKILPKISTPRSARSVCTACTMCCVHCAVCAGICSR